LEFGTANDKLSPKEQRRTKQIQLPSSKSLRLTRYRDWRQVAGYFDGDGTVGVWVRKCVVVFYLGWCDSAVDQILQLGLFLRSQGTITSAIYAYRTTTAYTLQVRTQNSAIRLASEIFPFCFKKREELRALLGYYEDKMTGNQALAIINKQIRRGYRLGRPFPYRLPFTHSIGVLMARKRTTLSDLQARQITRRYRAGESSYKLGREFGVSSTTILNIVNSFA
jgi:hypothetical protein